MKRIKDMIFQYLLNYFTKNGYIIKYENTPFTKSEMVMFLEKKGYTLKHNDYYQKSFVFVILLDDFIEIKTVYTNNKVLRISKDLFSLKSYLEYLEKIN